MNNHTIHAILEVYLSNYNVPKERKNALLNALKKYDTRNQFLRAVIFFSSGILFHAIMIYLHGTLT